MSIFYISVGMIVAFGIGTLVFREPLTNWILGSLSIPLLIFGVCLIISCEQRSDGNEHTALPTSEIELTVVSIDPSGGVRKHNNSSLFDEEETMSEDNSSRNLTIIGIFFCIFNGFCDGSLVVPFKLLHTNEPIEMLNYISSFSFGALSMSTILFSIYFRYVLFYKYRLNSGNQSVIVTLMTALWPGASSGSISQSITY